MSRSVCSARRIGSSPNRYRTRRAELALYVLPRAADSLYRILMDHRLMVKFGQAGDVALFAGSMGVLMHFLKHERKEMGTLLRRVLDRFVNVSAKPQYNV